MNGLICGCTSRVFEKPHPEMQLQLSSPLHSCHNSCHCPDPLLRPNRCDKWRWSNSLHRPALKEDVGAIPRNSTRGPLLLLIYCLGRTVVGSEASFGFSYHNSSHSVGQVMCLGFSQLPIVIICSAMTETRRGAGGPTGPAGKGTSPKVHLCPDLVHTGHQHPSIATTQKKKKKNAPQRTENLFLFDQCPTSPDRWPLVSLLWGEDPLSTSMVTGSSPSGPSLPFRSWASRALRRLRLG